MRLVPYVLIMLSVLNLLYGFPALLGHHGHIRKSLPALDDKLLSEDAVAIYGLVFGTLAVLMGLVRLAAGWALLGRERVDKELYILACLSFALEILRDAQLSTLVKDTSESVSIAISAAFLVWFCFSAKHYIK
jgi:hypothetical protein